MILTNDEVQALELFNLPRTKVIVSDDQLPGRFALGFIFQLGIVSPDTAKVLITAFGDLPTTRKALNSSKCTVLCRRPGKTRRSWML